MKYFKDITTIEQAKLQYRKLAKQLHPDAGGSASEFMLLQREYKTVLLQLQDSSINRQVSSQQHNELLKELAKLAKVLIAKQIPQTYLKQKVESSKSELEKSIFSGIIEILEKI